MSGMSSGNDSKRASMILYRAASRIILSIFVGKLFLANTASRPNLENESFSQDHAQMLKRKCPVYAKRGQG
jgi:hypothetical protein